MKALKQSKNVWHVFDKDGWKHAFKAIRSPSGQWAIHPYHPRDKITPELRDFVYLLK